MMERDTVVVDGKEVNAARLLAALHNGTQPLGMGWLSAIPPISEDAAAADLAKVKRFDFDYYHGRPLKVREVYASPGTIDTESSRRLYDRDAGEGAFDRAVAEACAYVSEPE